jgi:peptide/nickel transport system substrate-binding protein
MDIDDRELDELRRQLAPSAHYLVESLRAGGVGRREFLRHAAVLGLSLPWLGARRTDAATASGTLRLGQITPTGAVEAVRVADPGGITQLAICGEYLCVNGPDFVLRPALAASWAPNLDATVWTFKIRDGVLFHDGKRLTAADVVATFARLADPGSESNALIAFEGYLSPRGIRAIDPLTVEFRLDAPHGQFPYLVSSETPNAIILPETYRGDYELAQIGTGPFKLEEFSQNTGAVFMRNPAYWGTKAVADRLEVTFYADDKSQLEALRQGKVDVLARLPQELAAAVAGEPGLQIIRTPSSAHNQVHMRTDMGPFQDSRVRRAVAMVLDRPKLGTALLGGLSQPGNDSPFAPFYPTTDKSVAQRTQNLIEAKALLKAAGHETGFTAELTTQSYQELPAFAKAIQVAGAEIGIKLTINTLSPAAYFADGVFGKSPWLDSVMGITDYAHHGTPNAHLIAPLRSDGAWNAAHYKNPTYDRQVASYIAALDLDSQRKAAGELQKTLLDDTPVLFAYFTDALAAAKKGLNGVQISPLGQVWLAAASLAG